MITPSHSTQRGFWVPPMRFMSEGGERVSKIQLASILHQLFFEGELLFESGEVVNNITLREMAICNPTVRHLCNSGHIKLLLAKDGPCRSIQDIAKYVDRTGSRQPHIDRERFLNGDDLEILASGGVEEFELASYHRFYTASIFQAIKHAENQGDLSHRIADLIKEFLEFEIDSKGSTNVSYFKANRLGKYLKDRLPGEALWEEYYEKLRLISLGPALAFWATTFSASPCYAPEHILALQYYGGFRRPSIDSGSECTTLRSRLGGDTYVHGLSSLLPDDVEELLQCYERQFYWAAVHQVGGGKHSIQNLTEAFETYRSKIESIVARRLTGIPTARRYDWLLRTRSVEQAFGEAVVFQLLDAVTFGFASFAWEMTKLYLEQKQPLESAQQKLEQLADHIDQVAHAPKEKLDVTKNFRHGGDRDSMVNVR